MHKRDVDKWGVVFSDWDHFSRSIMDGECPKSSWLEEPCHPTNGIKKMEQDNTGGQGTPNLKIFLANLLWIYGWTSQWTKGLNLYKKKRKKAHLDAE